MYILEWRAQSITFTTGSLGLLHRLVSACSSVHARVNLPARASARWGNQLAEALHESCRGPADTGMQVVKRVSGKRLEVPDALAREYGAQFARSWHARKGGLQTLSLFRCDKAESKSSTLPDVSLGVLYSVPVWGTRAESLRLWLHLPSTHRSCSSVIYTVASLK